MFFDNLRRKTPAAALKQTTHRNASRLAAPLAGRVSCQTSSIRVSSFHLRSNGPAHKRSSTPHQLSQIVISGASHRFPAVFSVFANGEFRMAHRAYGAVSLLAKATRPELVEGSDPRHARAIYAGSASPVRSAHQSPIGRARFSGEITQIVDDSVPKFEET